MKVWDIGSMDVEPRQPHVVESTRDGRAIAIALPAGERLQEHEVHERAWLLVIGGRIEVRDAGGVATAGGPGLLAQFAPQERREVGALEDSRILLLLTPWPGEGHASERAREDPEAVHASRASATDDREV